MRGKCERRERRETRTNTKKDKGHSPLPDTPLLEGKQSLQHPHSSSMPSHIALECNSPQRARFALPWAQQGSGQQTDVMLLRSVRRLDGGILHGISCGERSLAMYNLQS